MSTTEMWSDAAIISGTDNPTADEAVQFTRDPQLTLVQTPIPEGDPGVVGAVWETLIRAWVRNAHSHWRVQHIESDVWVSDVVGCEGAWADGPTRAAAVANLESVLYEWVKLKLDDGDRDIPPMDGLSLVADE